MKLLVKRHRRRPVTCPQRKQELRGYLGYYYQFAGKIHTLVDRFVEGKCQRVALGRRLLRLISLDAIKFKSPKAGTITFYADATPLKMAAVILDPLNRKRKMVVEHRFDGAIPIIEAEIRALALAFNYLVEAGCYKRYRVIAYTDSMPALWFWRKGSSKFDSWSAATLYELLALRNSMSCYFDIDMRYVSTDVNPADFYSRTP
jgi:hypothetical protein